MRLPVTLLLASAALFPLGGPARSTDTDTAPTARSVILVCNAETEPAPQQRLDPSLSAAGVARANELARLLGASDATHVYATQHKSTQETVALLAERLEVAVEPLPAAKSEALIEQLDSLPAGSVAVVCGLSASIPRVAELLGVSLSGVIPVHATLLFREDSYDRVFVITRAPSGPPTCVELRYGADPKVEAGK